MAKKKESAQLKAAKARAKAAEKLAKEVLAALEEAGYEFPELSGPEEMAEFAYEKGYLPDKVFLSTLQVAELDPDWKDKIVPPAKK